MKEPLDYIFIDTCTFMKSPYFKKDGAVSRLFDYAKQGFLNLLMPEITRKEWLKHYNEACSLQFEKIEKKAALMGNTEEVEGVTTSYKGVIQAYNEMVAQTFNYHLKKARAIDISTDYAGDLIRGVFDKYFAVVKPFGSNGKSKEFPDAFALALLEKYATEHGINKVIVFSSDKDLIEYKSTIIQVQDTTDFLNELVTVRIPEKEHEKVERDMEIIRNYIRNLPEHQTSYFSDKIEDYLSDETLYEDRFNYEEIAEVNVKSLNLEPTAKDMEVLEVNQDVLRIMFFVEFDSTVIVRHLSEEESVWDSEEKEWAYKVYRDTEVEIGTAIKVSAEFERNELDSAVAIEGKFTDLDFDDIRDYLEDDGYSCRRVNDSAFLHSYSQKATKTPISYSPADIAKIAQMPSAPPSLLAACSSFKAFQEQINTPEVKKHLAQIAAISGSMSSLVSSIQESTKNNTLSSLNSLSAMIEAAKGKI